MTNRNRASRIGSNQTAFVTFSLARIHPLSEAERDVILTTLEKERELGTHIPAFVIMPDHIHLLMSCDDLSAILKRIKGVSSRHCNQLSNSAGTLWQADSYIEWITSSPHYTTVLKYIYRNPVKSGIACKSNDYRWLSLDYSCSTPSE